MTEEDGDEEEEEAEEDDDDDDEEEDEEDEEPALKYERLSAPVDTLLRKDSASAVAVSSDRIALGTHAGYVHILKLNGERVKSYKPHTASILDMSLDATGDFFTTASIDGQIAIHSLSTPENYVFDMKRPMRTVALEPGFARKKSRAFVCGGMAGTLILREKSWFGHSETTLHSGEGPIYQVRWRDRLIVWANDLGVKLYDTASQSRIAFIDRPPDSPRADLFKCTLYWQDDSTLILGWADHIKVLRIRTRTRNSTGVAGSAGLTSSPPLVVEVTAVFQLDCMIAGIVPHTLSPASVSPPHSHSHSKESSLSTNGTVENGKDSSSNSLSGSGTGAKSLPLTSFLVLAYSPPDTYGDEATQDRARQARKAAERPELRIISRAGEELTADALGVANFQAWSCNDYVLAEVGALDPGLSVVPPAAGAAGALRVQARRSYVVVSPKDIVVVRPRDRRDHIAWLVEHQRYDEALGEVEKLGDEELGEGEARIDANAIGERYIKHLVGEGDFVKAAKLCPKVCGHDVKQWEDWIFLFAQKQELQAIIPYIPVDSPQLGHMVYEMVIGHYLTHDKHALFETIKSWPKTIYDIPAVINAIQSALDRSPSTSSATSISSSSRSTTPDAVLLMECLAELYTANRQYGKALPFYLRLRRPNVFELIREHNLFTDVQDQALLLVEFDQELIEKRRREGVEVDEGGSEAIRLLVDHTYSIPIRRVVQQIESRPHFLFLYLDALSKKDPHLTSSFADLQVKLCADYAPSRLIDFLRQSNYYNLEAAYKACGERDLVPEMVFLLGRMGNNKQALTLIIERLGDVERAIEFAKEQADDDLWEDLLKYSETRPAFIRGLLENVGVEIDPVRLVRRIKNGLEIPGLKDALIKILHDFHLQISLLEGCQTILEGDGAYLTRVRQRSQMSGFFLGDKSECMICSKPLLRAPQDLLLLFLCRHVVHAACVPDLSLDDLPWANDGVGIRASLSGRIAFTSVIRARIHQGCPVCLRQSEGEVL
ncbi:vacuolar protein sorting-associated protein 41 [Coniophora puteana RWD-64-598 SS2]|uniref:Vacuolar protein sorting-associated protein 41 n=1 Tax=Coniophora puteana (strain RWD-64-598) TaxID=741705 RepID=A0A5M3MC03_CONPW|nr:vacuolar protein sorting-associated protein 41 [Coniophora puteana RWD-64-598 SS2]EIW76424.1 vacuolar protein sorting-associated protein 41 [Coniophora puteana RWD-64-598 SS2]